MLDYNLFHDLNSSLVEHSSTHFSNPHVGGDGKLEEAEAASGTREKRGDMKKDVNDDTRSNPIE